MGFLDYRTSATSKKHVDFSDARYQYAEKLKQTESKNIRSSFTLYDSREYKKTAVQDISAAYALSDKRLPMGELLNKMIDLILDMEDGTLDTEKDAVYAWKYSQALLDMFEDKSKRQEKLTAFDNSLKSSMINSRIFQERYPKKYTLRTNFFDPKVKDDIITDVMDTFRDVALPGIHDTAVKQSHENAEKHNNPILDKIVKWAIENYNCQVDSFFQVKEYRRTKLFFSVNTVIIHLRNGYDMSIVGYVGTDYDDKFAVSVLDTQKITIQKHGEHISQKDLQAALEDASEAAPINPLTKLLEIEKQKNVIFKKQYDILAKIRPMVPAEALKIQAAESVVGCDYIWGCAKYRETHDDLPEDFKLEDVILPEYIETEEQSNEKRKNKDLLSEMKEIASTIEAVHEATSEDVEEKVAGMVEEVELSAEELAKQKVLTAPTTKTAEDLLRESGPIKELFENEKPKQVVKEEPKFGEKKEEFEMPTLTIPPQTAKQEQKQEEKKEDKKDSFDSGATLLPGSIPVIQRPKESNEPSVTKDAKPAPEFNTSSDNSLVLPGIEPEKKPDPVVKEENQEETGEPDLILDDLDSLFG